MKPDSEIRGSESVSQQTEVFTRRLREVWSRHRKEKGTPADFYFSAGGASIALHFDSPSLLEFLTPALRHLERGAVKTPDLKVFLLEGEEVPTLMPLFRESLPRHSRAAQFETGGVKNWPVYYMQDGPCRGTYQYGEGIVSLSFLRGDQNEAFFWVPDVSRIPSETIDDRAAPLRSILFWWFRERRCHFVHAASAGTKDGGLLIVGPSGAGKTGTVLSCLEGGMFYAGDDYVLVEESETPRVHSLYNSVKLWPGDLACFELFKPLASSAESAPGQKCRFFLERAFPERMASVYPLKAVVVPCVTETGASLEPISPAKALRAIAPSTLYQLPGAGQETLNALSRIVRSVPCFRFDTGQDRRAQGLALAGLLSGEEKK